MKGEGPDGMDRVREEELLDGLLQALEERREASPCERAVAIDDLDRLIDGKLSSMDEQRVRDHLGRCLACLDLYGELYALRHHRENTAEHGEEAPAAVEDLESRVAAFVSEVLRASYLLHGRRRHHGRYVWQYGPASGPVLECQEAVDIFADCLEGALPWEVVKQLGAHTDECASCRKFLNRFRASGRAVFPLPESGAVLRRKRADTDWWLLRDLKALSLAIEDRSYIEKDRVGPLTVLGSLLRQSGELYQDIERSRIDAVTRERLLDRFLASCVTLRDLGSGMRKLP